MKQISAYFYVASAEQIEQIKTSLVDNELIANLYFIANDKIENAKEDVTILPKESIFGSAYLDLVAKSTTDFALVHTTFSQINFSQNCVKRMYDLISQSDDINLIYSDYYRNDRQIRTIDYFEGSVRDDFDFGSLILLRTDYLKHVQIPKINHSAFYFLTLWGGLSGKNIRLPEFLYTEYEDNNSSQFDYVNPRNREVQVEREQVFTAFLKAYGAFLEPRTKTIDVFSGDFANEVSVIIPVKNRAKTIKDAIESALSQLLRNRTFNVIVVDNYSNDGTSEIIEQLAGEHKNLVHLVPQRTDLGIGGCWNEAINSEHCGRFAVQLDSDDVYSSSDVLQQIVDKFYEQRCAMVVGSYTLTDENMNVIPPGLIDHKEWTDENGHNNALRINGLGAPRAFFTPVAREIQFPNSSYGEDYTMALRISREYKIGRIFESLYFCRRWGGNSDANLTQESINRNNLYKDRIRTFEILARKQLVKNQTDTTPKKRDFLTYLKDLFGNE